MKFSFFTLVKFGFGLLAWKRKYPEAVDDFFALLATLSPDSKGVAPSEAIDKVRNGTMTAAERSQFDRASGSGGL